MKLSNLLRAMDDYEIVTIVRLCGVKSGVVFSGGSNDFHHMDSDYEVVLFQKEKDCSYTILVK